MSEDAHFYGGNGEEAFTTGKKVGQSTARAIAFDLNKKHNNCESDGRIRSSYRLRIDR